MTVAVLSDIHGNLEALDAVLADVDRRSIRHLACIGDFVGYGANPNECVERLRPRIEAAVVGNHDVAACGGMRLGGFHSEAATAARWTAGQLEPRHSEWLMSIPYTVLWRSLRLVHASPSAPQDWHYVLSIADAEEELPTFDEQVCIIGHSHVAGAFLEADGSIRYTRDDSLSVVDGQRMLVNAGSVGQPRDGDPRAAYLLIDEDEHTLTHVRLEYDVDGAMAKIRAAGLPDFLAERLRWGE